MTVMAQHRHKISDAAVARKPNAGGNSVWDGLGIVELGVAKATQQ